MKYSDTINFVNRDDKKLLGGIQMNTKTFEQFDVMTDAELSTVGGGGKGYCKPVYYAANGYSCRYSSGEWGYVVTKGTFQATTDVIATGWVSSLGGAYGYATSWGRRL